MSDTGPQPHQPSWTKLAPGQAPPQFVVVSWDGGGESNFKLNSHFQKVAQQYGASMTFFLSGIYFLPRSKKDLYTPPGHKPGASDIGYFPDKLIHSTIEQIGKAWTAGHEIGTHFNGHFCGPKGVQTWSVADWKTEIALAEKFVAQWRTNTGFTDLPPLPFDYRKELIGGRTPCLEGTDNVRKAAAELGWRYDSSGSRYAMWPKKVDGIWDLSMQSVPFSGSGPKEVIAMDYNFLANQSKVTKGDPAQYPKWKQQMVDSLMAGFRNSYEGNRSPLIIGNHFEQWNGGIYMEAVAEVMRQVSSYPEAKMVSFRQLCDWLDAQDPAVIADLQKLYSAPSVGWSDFRAA
ncbi:hypothetical protein ACMYYO_13510 [Dermacoccaceae bacterium W4C1]